MTNQNTNAAATLFGLVGASVKTPKEGTSDGDVAALLAHDPLQAAEDFAGRAVHELGLGYSMAFTHTHGSRKDAALTARGDTTLNNGLDRYVSIIEGYGFVLAGNFPFIDRRWDNRPENFYVYVQPELGLVLRFDTFGECKEKGRHVNGGTGYYNWKPADRSTMYVCTSSGGFHNYDTDPVWVGNHDAREALIFKMERLRNNRTLLPKWEANPFLWFLHHDDTYNAPYEAAQEKWWASDRSEPRPQSRDFPEGAYDYDAINRERIAAMPMVQEILAEYPEAIIKAEKGGTE